VTGLLTTRNRTLKTVVLLITSGKRCWEIHALDSESAYTFTQIVFPKLSTDSSDGLQHLSLYPVKTLRGFCAHTESVQTLEQKATFHFSHAI